MTPVTQITEEEFREMIETVIDEKLLELVGDLDERLTIRKTIRNSLL